MRLRGNANYNEPVESGTIYEVKVNNLRVCIHRIVGLHRWYLNCHQLGIKDKELKSQDLFACVKESRKIMRLKLKELTDNVNIFCIDDPIEITR